MGILYLVATPIGNLEDMSFRGIRILEEVDYIAAEDTRHTVKLLNHFDIQKHMVSYHEHNRYEKAPELIQDLKDGKNIALVTDAGTPAISDPGEDLVRLCHEEGIKVTSIPGPVALINALILSGKDTRRFVFEGFLPVKKKERQKRLSLLEKETRTMVFYEAPHKLKATLSDFYQVFGGERSITFTRELTKKYEEVLVFSIHDAIKYYKENDPRGEYVIIIEGMDLDELEAEKIQAFEQIPLEEQMTLYLRDGMTKKEAIKQIAKDRGKPKREIYDYFKN